MVDEACLVANESRIDCAFGAEEVVKRRVHAERLTEEINAVLYHLSAVYHYQIILFKRLPSE